MITADDFERLLTVDEQKAFLDFFMELADAFDGEDNDEPKSAAEKVYVDFVNSEVGGQIYGELCDINSGSIKDD